MQIAMKMGTGVVQADSSVSQPLVLPKQRQNYRQTSLVDMLKYLIT